MYGARDHQGVQRNVTDELSPSDASALDGIVARQARAAAVATGRDLADLWLDFVREVEEGYEPTLDDYVNDLALRKIWARVANASPEGVRQRVDQWLARLDARLRSATVEVPRDRRKSWQTIPDRIPRKARDELWSDLKALGLDDLLEP